MSDIIITPEMVEDLLHRNKVDIDYAKKDIKRFYEFIKMRKEFIKRLLIDRDSLFEALKKVKQEWKV
jgi:hypothetical protein